MIPQQRIAEGDDHGKGIGIIAEDLVGFVAGYQQHIIAAAAAALCSLRFEGGDEFIGVIMNNLGKVEKEFLKQVDRINADESVGLKVPLSIAYGSAEFISGKSDLEEIEAIADGQMYKMKKQMKAERKD